MTADCGRLRVGLEYATTRLEPLGDRHREALRVACAADDAIWDIYPVSFGPGHFDASLDAILGDAGRCQFAVLEAEVLVGMTGYLNIAEAHAALEIGATYLHPRVRGTGLNGRIKTLMIDHAFACGFDRIEIRVDTRNARSLAAIAKLGAVHEGVLRRNMITWTGHVRDTAIFSILRDPKA